MTITHIPQKRRRAMLLALAGVAAMALAGCGGGGVTNPPASAGGNNCGDFASSFSCITFDSASVTYTLTGFGGAEDSTVAPDPTGGTNKAARVVKSATAETFAGTTVSTGPNSTVTKIPFDAKNTRMSVRVFSPRAGIRVRLKVEDAADPTRSVETEATATVANAWQTLTFDFANPAGGSAPLNFAYTYNKISIFFDFGVSGAAAGGAKTYNFDDIAFIGGTSGGGGGGGAFTTITFDSPTVTYTLTGFGGAEDSSVVADPAGGTNKVAKVLRSATAETFAGTTVSTGPNRTVGKIPFDAANTRMTVRVYSPNAGIKVRLKVEDAADATHSAETDATTTVANAWETLTFDFANPATGTPPLNFAYTYNKATIFFNFGVSGAIAGAKTYYFDDVAFIGGTGGGGGGGGGTGGTFSPISFDSATVTYTLTGFGGAEDSSVVADPVGGTNKVAKVVRSATAETFAGTTVSTGPNNSVGKIPFDAANTRMTVRVYSPNAGIKVRLKVEDAADATHSAETEATTTVANAWETLTFDFANPAAGTAALNFSYTYNKTTIFFNFGVSGATAGAKTYYFDDVTFIGGTGGSGGGGGGGGGSGTFSPINFDSTGIVYTLTGFGGAEDSSLAPDPANAANTVAKVVKSATAEVWAGTTVSTGREPVGRQDPVRRGQHAHDGAGLLAERGLQGAAQGRGRGGRHAFGRDRGDHHGRQRLGDADVRLRQPGGRDGGAQLQLHVQQDLDLLQLRD